jgi:hypothetical protein
MTAKFAPGPEARAQIVADYENGLGAVAVGVKNGVSLNPILRLLREEGIPIRKAVLNATGNRYGDLIVLRRANERKGKTGGPRWVCRCIRRGDSGNECGQEVTVSSDTLIRPRKSTSLLSCGQHRPAPKTGHPVLGEIRRGDEVGFKIRSKVIWHACEGNCGKESWVGYSVAKGQPKSLRCVSCSNKTGIIDLTGKTIGLLVVKERVVSQPDQKTRWLCYCKCGNPEPCVVLAGNLGRSTRSCGCLRRGTNNSRWAISRQFRVHGYVYWRWGMPDGRRVTVSEHQIVMESMIGRELRTDLGEEVHHKNTIKDDNRPGNLELWSYGQPKGGRVIDRLKWMQEFAALYGGRLDLSGVDPVLLESTEVSKSG